MGKAKRELKKKVKEAKNILRKGTIVSVPAGEAFFKEFDKVIESYIKEQTKQSAE